MAFPPAGQDTVGCSTLERLWRGVQRRKSPAAIVAEQASDKGNGAGLRRSLGLMDVLGYGISSTLGAGLFVVTGKAAHDFAGPAVCMSYTLAGGASLLSALCYAEFATQIPVSGSAYSYVYVSLGEGWAWMVGWNLILEYGVAASAVARGWASYFVRFCQHCGAPLPSWCHSLQVPLWPASAGSLSASPLAAAAVLLCSAVLLMGVSESARLNLAITALNLAIISFIIAAGVTHLQPSNWEPWAPEGLSGIVAGSAYVFFSYIGFDSVCTLAEEMRDPRRDLPLGIMGSLVVVTLLYVAASLVVTGLTPAADLDLQAPLSEAFTSAGMPWAASAVAMGSVTSLSGTVLCSLFGQPRIFFRMAKDGLLPPPFMSVGQSSQVPVFGTIFTGTAAGLLAFLLDGDTLMDLISIGTLMAFVVVCLGLLAHRLEPTSPSAVTRYVRGTTSLTWIWAFCAFAALSSIGIARGWKTGLVSCSTAAALACIAALTTFPHRLTGGGEADTLPSTSATEVAHQGETAGQPPPSHPVQHRQGVFLCPWVPLLPCLGAWVNIYLMASLPATSGVRLLVWSAAGAAVYLSYGVWHSKTTDGAATKAM